MTTITTADPEYKCSAVSAMLVKNVKNTCSVKTASDMQKYLAARKTHFYSHYIYNAF